MALRVERLTEDNFADYEKLTNCEGGGGCYCSFWHQKITSMEEWDQRKQLHPKLNRQVVLDKVKVGFHVGVLVYEEQNLVAWISICPLTDCYWTWRRLATVGPDGKFIAAILCFTLAPERRGQHMQAHVLEALVPYAKAQGWKAIEAYPFTKEAVAKNGKDVHWPGFVHGYLDAGYITKGPHWLSSPDAERLLLERVL